MRSVFNRKTSYISLRNRTAFIAYSDEGADYGKFINALKNSPIQFYGLSVRRERIYGYVRSIDMDRLTALAAEYRLNVETASKRGIYYVTDGYHLRFGAAVGFLLAAAMLFFLSDRVAVIEVGGNESVSEERIISLLRDSGIYIGSKISDVDLRAAERSILGMDKNIAWIGIRHTGSRVVVEIDEINEIPLMERKNNPSNIVAARDAQIKNVRVYSGMLIPMVGDAVKKGDVIISGVVDTKYGRSYYVHSMGEITGVYTEKMTFSQPLTAEEQICTGEIEKKAFSVFGKRFVYFSEGEIPEDFEYYEEEFPLKLGEIMFPVSKVEMHYRILETENTVRTEDEARAILEKKASDYENNFFPGDVKIINKEVNESYDGKTITHTVVYTIEGEIGSSRQIFAKYEGYEGKTVDK